MDSKNFREILIITWVTTFFIAFSMQVQGHIKVILPSDYPVQTIIEDSQDYCISHSLGSNNRHQQNFSVAGLFPSQNSVRGVSNFNVGWRYFMGDIPNAEKAIFDDSEWDVISTPHTVELMPAEGSGCRNYQGIVWYRKHFVVDSSLSDKLINIYFEAVMGKTSVFLNGEKILDHKGGYLPFSIELTQYGIKPGDECVIALSADNSDDIGYPPGKKQSALDFTYYGGIYRDVWMITTSKIHITDPNKVDKIAGGGIFVHYGNIDRTSAEIFIDTDIANRSDKNQNIVIQTNIIDPKGQVIKTLQSKGSIKRGIDKTFKQKVTVKYPELWSPDTPSLYKIDTKVLSNNGKILDGGITKIGLRKTEFRGKDGFWLNGERYDKLIGGNRHQDYAYVGNAMPNSQHWRDAKKLRDAGCKIIRSAHYPQDPSFMDACDELGLFVIVATPGWQFWNKDPQFAEFIYSDIRNMVRRDRNRPSVLMWEPVLNETGFPLEFSLKAQKTVYEEYPYPGCFCVADNHSKGVADNYEVVYGWTRDTSKFKQCVFTREFGDNVDDWYAHNAINRASRSWGEVPQIKQSLLLADVYNSLCVADPQFIGGALWHPFDHQRGYHPDPFWGGIMDAFRQPKYAYYMFKSQVLAAAQHPIAETGPMVYFAHELSPFSEADVIVFSNCDEVRLIVYGKDTLQMKVPREKNGMPNPPVTFRDIYDFNEMRRFSYSEKNWKKASFVAEGIIDGKVVCSTKKMPSRRSAKLKLTVDHEGQKLVADGSDFVTVICEVTDDEGNVRRLAKDRILFTVEGEGEIIGDDLIRANPREVEFGSAPVLIRSTLQAGKIKVNARVLYEGEHAPTPAFIEFESIESPVPLVYKEKPRKNGSESILLRTYNRKLTEEEKQKALREVEIQQTQFGEKK